jgi:glycopeptide antibiotics resistance protein
MFIPMGFLLPIVFHNLKNSIIKTILWGMTLSIIIEISQFIFPMNRIADIDDVILNIIGIIFGFCISRFLARINKLYSKKENQVNDCK